MDQMDPMASSNMKLSGTPGRCNPHAIDLRGPFPGKKILHGKDMERPGGNIQISELFRMGQAGSPLPHLPHPQRLCGTRVF